jgi:2-phospho-L-lactate guanylyltransferase
MIAALVPVKTLASSKSRLLPYLGRSAVERLSIAMLRDLLETLQNVRALQPVVVVTPDPEVARVANEAGAQTLLLELPGLNPSIEQAAAAVAPEAGDAVLVVLGDVAGARVADIETLLGAVPDGGVALAPSSDGGTSALLRRPRDIIAASFGPDSAAVHRDLATRAGVPFEEIPLDSLAVDIDEPEDLEKFVHSASAGERTRALLRELLPELAP